MAGNITIVEAKERYVKVPRDLTKGDISLAAVGLYAAILSLGKDWQLNIRGLSSVLDVSVMLIKKYMGELERAGYVHRTRSKGEDGRFIGWDYQVGVDPFTDIAKTPTSEKTDRRKNRPSEKPTVGETDSRKTEPYNKDSKTIEDINERQDYNQPIASAGFNFRKALIDLGVPAALADDWLAVRHTKRATNTRTAFENIAREIEKSHRPAEDCIRFVVERSWSGFRAEWMNEERPAVAGSIPNTPRRQENFVEHWNRVDRELAEIIPGYGKNRTDNQ